jgi:Ca2+-binding RTX toxin-like protein
MISIEENTMLDGIFASIASGFQTRTRSQQQKLSAAVFEVLEKRQLLSVTSSMSSNVLTVTGDTAANNIIIQDNSGTLVVKDGTTTINSYPGAGTSTTLIVISAGSGNDILTIAAGVASNIPTSLNGEGGNDTLIGGAGADTLAGGSGSDTYPFSNSGTNPDTVDEAANTDTDTVDLSSFSGDAARIDLSSTEAQQQVTASSGALKLTLTNDSGIEYVIGTSLADSITGNARANTIIGGEGNDTIHAGAEADHIYGDLISLGGNGADEGDDQIFGDAGDDIIQGDSADLNSGAGYGYGKDSIDGGDDDDYITGDGGDYLGDHGEDTLIGGRGDDTLIGEHGSDLYLFNPLANQDWGSDIITEGAGVFGNINILDFSGLIVPTGVAGITVDMSTTAAQTVTTAQLTLAIQSAFVDILKGSGYKDTITGDSRGNTIYGGAGDDSIDGGAGADLIHGDDDDDILIGGSGADALYGDEGADHFRAQDGSVDSLFGGNGSDTASLLNSDRDSNDVLNSIENTV